MPTAIDLPHITEWGIKHDPKDSDLIYRGAFWPHIMFVRDKLARQLAETVDHTYDEYRELVRVCGNHRSKSVTLPVFSIDWKRGIRFTLRYNFYDWGVSIEANKPVVWDFNGLCRPDEVTSYCEGFPEDRLFEAYDKNHSRFTVGLRDDFDVYAFFHLLQRQFPHDKTATS